MQFMFVLVDEVIELIFHPCEVVVYSCCGSREPFTSHVRTCSAHAEREVWGVRVKAGGKALPWGFLDDGDLALFLQLQERRPLLPDHLRLIAGA